MTDIQKTSWMADFSTRQKKIVTYGITSLAICAIALLVTLMVLIGGKAIKIISPAISPVVLGLLLSLVLGRIFEKIPEKIRSCAYWAMWLVIVGIIIVTMWIWGEKIWAQVDTLVQTARNTYHSVVIRMPQLKGLDSEVKISAFLIQCTTFFISGLQNISTWLFAIFFGYCFIKCPINVDRIIERAKGIPFLSFSDKTWMFLQERLKDLVDMLTRYFPNQLLINFIEGMFGAIGMLLIDIPSGIVLGFLMGFMNIIPLVGTFLMLPVILAVAFFCEGGSILLVLLAFCVWVFIEVFDLVVPHIVHGKGMNLPAGVTVFSFLFWGALIDPVWGMILAIPLTAFSKSFYRAVKDFLKNNNDYTAGNSEKERKVQ